MGISQAEGVVNVSSKENSIYKSSWISKNDFEELKVMNVWILEFNSRASRDETSAVLLDVVLYFKNKTIPFHTVLSAGTWSRI